MKSVFSVGLVFCSMGSDPPPVFKTHSFALPSFSYASILGPSSLRAMDAGSACPFRISLLGPRTPGPHVNTECVCVYVCALVGG